MESGQTAYLHTLYHTQAYRTAERQGNLSFCMEEKMILADERMIGTTATGAQRWQVVIMSQSTPASLNLTGADVDGMEDTSVIAAGSVLLTPDKTYLAFVDGTFTERG